MRRTAAITVLLLAVSCSAKTPAHSPTPSSTATATATPTPAATFEFTPRPGTKMVQTIRAGDEVAIWSQATSAPQGSVLRQSYVDVYNANGTKRFSATRALTVDPKVVSQEVQFFRFVTFDSTPDLVLGVLNEGASAGPLDLWVWDQHSRVVFHYSTTVDGQLSANGNQLTLDTGDYKPSDPMCCPSAMAHIVIGSKDGTIAVLSKTTTKS